MKKSNEEKSRRLLDEMGSLDPKYIDTAAGNVGDPYADAAISRADRRARRVILAAACIILAVVVVLPTVLFIAKQAQHNPLPSGTPDGGEAVTDSDGCAVTDADGRTLWHYTDGKYYRVPQGGGTWIYDPADQPDSADGTRDSGYDDSHFTDKKPDEDVETSVFVDDPVIGFTLRRPQCELTFKRAKSCNMVIELPGGGTVDATVEDIEDKSIMALELAVMYVVANYMGDMESLLSLFPEDEVRAQLIAPLAERYPSLGGKDETMMMLQSVMEKTYSVTRPYDRVLVCCSLDGNADEGNGRRTISIRSAVSGFGSFYYVNAYEGAPTFGESEIISCVRKDGVWYLDSALMPDADTLAPYIEYGMYGEKMPGQPDVISFRATVYDHSGDNMYLKDETGAMFAVSAPRERDNGFTDYINKDGSWRQNPFKAGDAVIVNGFAVGPGFRDAKTPCMAFRAYSVIGEDVAGVDDPILPPVGYISTDLTTPDGAVLTVNMNISDGLNLGLYRDFGSMLGQWLFSQMAFRYDMHFGLFEASFVKEMVMEQFPGVVLPEQTPEAFSGTDLIALYPQVFELMMKNGEALRTFADMNVDLTLRPVENHLAEMKQEFAVRVAQKLDSPIEDACFLQVEVTEIRTGSLIFETDGLDLSRLECVVFYQHDGQWHLDPALMDDDLSVDLTGSDRIVQNAMKTYHGNLIERESDDFALFESNENVMLLLPRNGSAAGGISVDCKELPVDSGIELAINYNLLCVDIGLRVLDTETGSSVPLVRGVTLYDDRITTSSD